MSIIRAHYLDASAAVKLVIDELGSNDLRAYVDKHFGFYITSFCLFEALGVLKRMMIKRKISLKQYLDACRLLLAYLRAKPNSIQIEDDFGIDKPGIFQSAEQLAKLYHLDLSDALQLFTVKSATVTKWVSVPETLLITSDGSLMKAAKAEGLRVWNCEKEPAPPAQ